MSPGLTACAKCSIVSPEQSGFGSPEKGSQLLSAPGKTCGEMLRTPGKKWLEFERVQVMTTKCDRICAPLYGKCIQCPPSQIYLTQSARAHNSRGTDHCVLVRSSRKPYPSGRESLPSGGD